MAPRPPPTRPHIGIYPSSTFEGEWADDDAWDSASDEDSPRNSKPSRSWNRSVSSSVGQPSSSTASPKAVPKAPSMTSAVAFSYTHVGVPAPDSYSPKRDSLSKSQNGWTIVRTSREGRMGTEGKLTMEKDDTVNGDIDVDGDIIVGEDPEVVEEVLPTTKGRPDQGSIKSNVDEIVQDPLCGIQQRPAKHPEAASRRTTNGDLQDDSEKTEKLLRERSIRSNRRHKFIECLSNQDVNIAELRKLAWAGIPNDLRPLAWQLLLGYLPLPAPLRSSTLARKRGEYLSLVELAFARDRDGLDQQIWHQIEIDVPRTRPGVPLWMQAITQRCLERILYVWAIRHPTSGYVQGINDLVTPFFQVFLSSYIESDPELFDPSLLPPHVLNAIEADSFWCLSRLLDGIQDNYISAQPGIQRSVRRMAELVARIDGMAAQSNETAAKALPEIAPLSAHLDAQNVEFMQFAFRWMNCLLMREISMQNTIRMWDTYLAEGTDAFSQFHLYVCSAFLVKWSEKLRQMDFQGIIMFLQSLPTQDWGDHEIEMLLSEAFVLNSIWHNAQSHFNAT